MPRSDEPTNADRRARARAILDAYRDEHDQGADRVTVATDLLADLMHLLGLPAYGRALDSARSHYHAEHRERQARGLRTIQRVRF